jgi:hypothetical protein
MKLFAISLNIIKQLGKIWKEMCNFTLEIANHCWKEQKAYTKGQTAYVHESRLDIAKIAVLPKLI